jgi:hypothetical protein
VLEEDGEQQRAREEQEDRGGGDTLRGGPGDAQDLEELGVLEHWLPSVSSGEHA